MIAAALQRGHQKDYCEDSEHSRDRNTTGHEGKGNDDAIDCTGEIRLGDHRTSFLVVSNALLR
jgi:hypothetical protein